MMARRMMSTKEFSLNPGRRYIYFMKSFFLSIFLLVTPISMACEIETFRVYYIPLEVNFVVPPTREDILKLASFEIDSAKITCLFDLVSKQVGVDAKEWDYGRFRVLIQDAKKGKELIILSDKKVLFEKKVYKVDPKKIDAILAKIKIRAKWK